MVVVEEHKVARNVLFLCETTTYSWFCVHQRAEWILNSRSTHPTTSWSLTDTATHRYGRFDHQAWCSHKVRAVYAHIVAPVFCPFVWDPGKVHICRSKSVSADAA